MTSPISRSGSRLPGFLPAFLLILLCLPSASSAQAVYLWPNGAPGAKGTNEFDKPTITPYPASVKPNGAAVVVLPGGGYSGLASDHEGIQPAKWLNGLGVSAFVVKYRLGSNGYRHPIEMWDGQRAVRWVRANAKRYGIDPKRVGILGFSAGGHLASTVSTHYDTGSAAAADTVDRHSCRPDWSILAYPVVTMDLSFTHSGSRTNLLGNSPSQILVDSLSNEKQVTAKTPPAFLFHAKDDGVVPVKNAQAYHDSLAKRGVAVELKLYDRGGHGFGLANGVGGAPKDTVLATWAGLAVKWMGAQGFLTADPTAFAPRAAPSRSAHPESDRFRFGFGHEGKGWGFFDASGRRR
jgi:acetyl esterase/lipase